MQAYDAITQAIATTPGDLYRLSYDYANSCLGGDCVPPNTYQPLSTNGQPGESGNGRDMLVYAGAVPAAVVPEPPSAALLGAALAGCCWRASGAALHTTGERFSLGEKTGATSGSACPCANRVGCCTAWRR